MAQQTLSTLQILTLSDFREQLNERGIQIGMSTLSELISDGDIAEQLCAQRKGNRLLFPPAAVDTLAAFIPLFRENPNFKNSARPDALRSFLGKSPEHPAQGVTVPATLSEFRETANLGAQIVVAMQQAGLIPPPTDALLTTQQACDLLACCPTTLRRRIPPILPGRWKRSDLLRWIQQLPARKIIPK